VSSLNESLEVLNEIAHFAIKINSGSPASCHNQLDYSTKEEALNMIKNCFSMLGQIEFPPERKQDALEMMMGEEKLSERAARLIVF
jgi:hypothetical protein